MEELVGLLYIEIGLVFKIHSFIWPERKLSRYVGYEKIGKI
jgi:hypothetical protein